MTRQPPPRPRPHAPHEPSQPSAAAEKEEPYRPEKIVSGGQTGVDRAALDVAIELGIAHGGWCPRGRLAEDGPIPAKYRLRQTNSRQYPVRTQWNVRDSDATLILCRGQPAGGTSLTLRLAIEQAKLHLVIDLESQPHPSPARHWLASHRIQVLNIAGPRESQCPGIAEQAATFLKAVFGG